MVDVPGTKFDTQLKYQWMSFLNKSKLCIT